jgi:arylsulfatase
VVLLDDVGFGASSAPISTPTAERLAADGLKYTRFHTTALCSPTRQALLTGRNHHSVGMGGITEIAASAPGYNSIRPNTTAQLNWFQIDLDAAAEDLDHLITPEERLQIAMARQ